MRSASGRRVIEQARVGEVVVDDDVGALEAALRRRA